MQNTVVFFTHGEHLLPHIDSFLRYNQGLGYFIHLDTEPHSSKWRNHDRTIRDWWKENGHRVKSDYVWFFEWDALIRCNLSKIYLNYDIHCAYPRIHGIHDWQWWRHISRLPKKLHRYSRGMVPFGNFAIKTSAMDRIADVEWDGLFNAEIYSELRFPTLAHYLGLQIIQEPSMRYCGHIPINGSITKEGIFHPVKHAERNSIQ